MGSSQLKNDKVFLFNAIKFAKTLDLHFQPVQLAGLLSNKRIYQYTNESTYKERVPKKKQSKSKINPLLIHKTTDIAHKSSMKAQTDSQQTSNNKPEAPAATQSKNRALLK